MTITQANSGVTLFTSPSDTEIVATRAVDAPRGQVWKMWTSPDHLPHWMLGPEGWTMPVCEIDLRPGGTWRYVWRRADGSEMEMHGEYREVLAPERLVSTECWGGDWPETLNTLVLTQTKGKTTMVCTVQYPSKEARDAANATGMKDGWSASYDRLDEYLRSHGLTTVLNTKKGAFMRIQTYLYFDGRTQEAIEFYKKTLGAEVDMLMRYKDSPDQSMTPPDSADKVMHATFRVGETAVMASDGMCQGNPGFHGFSLSITVPTPAEAERLFAALGDGGQVQMPLAETFFSPRFGIIADRFGVSWMIYVAEPAA